MSDIFISYERSDKPRVQVIARALEAHGWTVWWDEKIHGDWRDTLKKELASARCVLVIWSKNAVNSDWVKKEADEGARRNILCPVLIEKADVPPTHDRIQIVDLTGWDETESSPIFQRLVADIDRIVSKPLRIRPKPLLMASGVIMIVASAVIGRSFKLYDPLVEAVIVSAGVALMLYGVYAVPLAQAVGTTVGKIAATAPIAVGSILFLYGYKLGPAARSAAAAQKEASVQQAAAQKEASVQRVLLMETDEGEALDSGMTIRLWNVISLPLNDIDRTFGKIGKEARQSYKKHHGGYPGKDEAKAIMEGPLSEFARGLDSRFGVDVEQTGELAKLYLEGKDGYQEEVRTAWFRIVNEAGSSKPLEQELITSWCVTIPDQLKNSDGEDSTAGMELAEAWSRTIPLLTSRQDSGVGEGSDTPSSWCQSRAEDFLEGFKLKAKDRKEYEERVKRYPIALYSIEGDPDLHLAFPGDLITDPGNGDAAYEVTVIANPKSDGDALPDNEGIQEALVLLRHD